MTTYVAKGAAIEDSQGNQILVMVSTNCSQKRLREIVKIAANVLNGIERGKEAAKTAIERRKP